MILNECGRPTGIKPLADLSAPALGLVKFPVVAHGRMSQQTVGRQPTLHEAELHPGPLRRGIAGRPDVSGLIVSGIAGHLSDFSPALRSFRAEIPAGAEGLIKDFRFMTKGAKSRHEFAYHSDQWLSEEEVKRLPKFKSYEAWEPTISDVPAITTIDLRGSEASAQGK